MYSRFLLLLVSVIGLAACSAPATPTVSPAETLPPLPAATQTPTVAPTGTPSPLPPATRTTVPTPTAFITPPSAGQSAIVPILMYHHLADLPKDATTLQLTWTVSPSNFQAQMDWLAEHGYHTVSMAQVAGHLKRGQSLPARPVVISFDDGWSDGYTVAFPMLRERHFTGTFFVYTNALDHKQFLTWAQVEEMAGGGMDIESHSLSHPHLRQLGPDDATNEIAGSKAILEKRLGKPVTSFDYPYGEYNAAVVDVVKRAGYETAVTIAAGYKQRADELFTLHRIRVSYNDTLQDVAARLP